MARHHDLPLHRDPSGRYLPWLVAVMVYLAALALTFALAMNGAIARWELGLSGRATIQIPQPEAGDAKLSDAVDRVIEVLLDTSGITSAEVLEPDEIVRLLEPWLGPAAASPDLPVPALIAVTVDAGAPPNLHRLADDLARIAPGTVIDDHESWLRSLREVARWVQTMAGLVVLLVGACAVSTVVFATRMGLSIHGDVIELLHLIGAEDSYVARQFQSHSLRLALRGGIFGLAFAALTLYVMGTVPAGVEVDFLPEFSLRPIEWPIVALLPFVVAVVAMLTARLTVLRTLGRMP